MKKYISALLLTVFIFIFTPNAFADTTTLTTSVPTKHSISLFVGSGGSVNGIRGNSVIWVDRHSKLILEIRPDSGCVIKSVTLNGADITAQLSGNTLVMESVEKDAVISVSFQYVLVNSPKTGDDTGLFFWAAVFAVSGVTLRIIRRKIRL